MLMRWVKLGFASTRPLKSWRVNLQERYQQLDDWINDPLNIPKAGPRLFYSFCVSSSEPPSRDFRDRWLTSPSSSILKVI